MFLALVWYAVDARKWFKGPRVNVDHLIHEGTGGLRLDDDSVVEGVEAIAEGEGKGGDEVDVKGKTGSDVAGVK